MSGLELDASMVIRKAELGCETGQYRFRVYGKRCCDGRCKGEVVGGMGGGVGGWVPVVLELAPRWVPGSSVTQTCLVSFVRSTPHHPLVTR